MTAHSTTVTITRPNDAVPYTAADVIGDVNGSAIFEFPNMGPKRSDVIITSIELGVDLTAIPAGMTGFTVRLFNGAPTARADNAVWDLASADLGKYIGKVVMATIIDESSTLFVESGTLNRQVSLLTNSLFVQLQTTDAWTPAAGTVLRLTIHTLEV